MKNIVSFIIVALVFINISFVSAEEDMRMCTMEYAPVCGIDGVTYGNTCGAGNVQIVHQGECKNYVNQTLYAKIESNTKATIRVEKALSNISLAQLDAAVINIEKRIQMVKMSRIIESVQIERITILTFLLDKISVEMNMRDVK